jgi:hypothetical protein
VKLHSCIAYREAGVDFEGLPICWTWYASPTTMSNGINMFFLGPSLELLHLHSHRSSELHFN